MVHKVHVLVTALTILLTQYFPKQKCHLMPMNSAVVEMQADFCAIFQTVNESY